jgi:hypothetical protein
VILSIFFTIPKIHQNTLFWWSLWFLLNSLKFLRDSSSTWGFQHFCYSFQFPIFPILFLKFQECSET